MSQPPQRDNAGAGGSGTGAGAGAGAGGGGGAGVGGGGGGTFIPQRQDMEYICAGTMMCDCPCSNSELVTAILRLRSEKRNQVERAYSV
jgi:hypothetical protein